MASNAPLLAQIVQSPLLISQDAQQLFQSSIQHVVAHQHADDMLATATNMQSDDDDFWPQPDNWRAAYRPYTVVNGVLQIPVMGVLLNRFPYQLGRWATGYAYIERALARGLADGNVKAIAFVIDSPGGEVAGCFELSDKIYEARGDKPIRAFAADHAYSAAYAIACSCDDIVVTRSGGVGSIGVVTAHVEYADALKEMGIKVTFIFAGKHKVDGNPYEKLPESVKSRIQERINRIYGVFTSTVARNRAMDEADVRKTEALTYDANEAITVGLADRIGALEDEMAIFADGTEQTEDEEMATTENTITQAVHDAAVAAATAAGKEAGMAEGKQIGLTEGAVAAKTRINAILESDEGKKRPKAAMSMALKTDLSAEQASALLADLAEEKAVVPAPAPKQQTGLTAFEIAMNNTPNPDISAGPTGDDDEQDGKKPAASSILADFAAASGIKRKQAAS